MDAMFQTNLVGTIHLTKIFLQEMLKATQLVQAGGTCSSDAAHPSFAGRPRSCGQYFFHLSQRCSAAAFTSLGGGPSQRSVYLDVPVPVRRAVWQHLRGFQGVQLLES